MVKVVTYLLENNAIVQGLLGVKSHGENHKVFPVIVTQDNKAPFSTVRQIDRTRLAQGLSCGTEYTILVSAYTESYDALDELCEAIVDAVEGQRGTINSVTVGYCNYDNQTDLEYDKDHGVYGRGTTFKVQCQ